MNHQDTKTTASNRQGAKDAKNGIGLDRGEARGRLAQPLDSARGRERAKRVERCAGQVLTFLPFQDKLRRVGWSKGELE